MVWLAAGHLNHFPKMAAKVIQHAELLYSPMVLLELEYLYEIRRNKLPARDIQRKVDFETGARLCEFPFASIASAALDEKWTRDPFDRLIVAHAKANGFASLISADEEIARHYPRTIW